MKTKAYGRSHQGRDLHLFMFGDLRKSTADIFIFAGVHGDEVEALIIGDRVLEWCLSNDTQLLSLGRKVLLLPRANPDGALACTRSNARGVDLNRNMDTQDWSPECTNPRYNPGPRALSENESQTLKRIVDTERPRFITTLHTFDPQINVNGPGLPWGKVMADITGYPMNTDIGYPTPGSFGTWAGFERKIPTITFEIRRHMDKDSDEWDKCQNALIEVILRDPT